MEDLVREDRVPYIDGCYDDGTRCDSCFEVIDKWYIDDDSNEKLCIHCLEKRIRHWDRECLEELIMDNVDKIF